MRIIVLVLLVVAAHFSLTPFAPASAGKAWLIFDPDTGLVSWFESMRYHGEASTSQVLWLNQSLEWSLRDGKPFSTVGAAIWMDDGKPWAVFTVEDVVYNVDVSEYIRAKGQ